MPDPAEARDRRTEAASAGASDPAWALVRRIGGGDQAALATLYRELYPRLSRFLMRIHRDTNAIDELVNEVMMVVWQKAAATEPRSRVSTWVFGIAYRRALKAGERGLRRSAEQSIDDAPALQLGASDGTLERLESAQLAARALQALSPEQRAVMELVYHEGLNYAEIASVLDCPENTVKTRMFHARRKLRECWPRLTGLAADNDRAGS